MDERKKQHLFLPVRIMRCLNDIHLILTSWHPSIQPIIEPKNCSVSCVIFKPAIFVYNCISFPVFRGITVQKAFLFPIHQVPKGMTGISHLETKDFLFLDLLMDAKLRTVNFLTSVLRVCQWLLDFVLEGSEPYWFQNDLRFWANLFHDQEN